MVKGQKSSHGEMRQDFICLFVIFFLDKNLVIILRLEPKRGNEMLDKAKLKLIQKATNHAYALEEIFAALRLFIGGTPMEMIDNLKKEESRLERRWQRRP